MQDSEGDVAGGSAEETHGHGSRTGTESAALVVGAYRDGGEEGGGGWFAQSERLYFTWGGE